MARKTHGTFYVGDSRKMMPTCDAAISLALSRARDAPGDCMMYVREVGGQGALARVWKVGKNIYAKRL